MPQNILSNLTANSGTSVTSPFGIIGASKVGVRIPAVNSCNMFVGVSFDTTSANFFRAWKADGSAVFSWPVASVNAALDLSPIIGAFPYARLEFSAALTVTTSFQIFTK